MTTLATGARQNWFSRIIGTLLAIGFLLSPLALQTQAEPRAKSKFNRVLRIGDAAPGWSDLPGVDDRRYSLSDFDSARMLVVVFTCNHCPVAKMYEERINDLAAKHPKEEVAIVAISVSRHPADTLDKMKLRVREKKLAYAYLADESQQSGRAYGATATPHFFVLDAKRPDGQRPIAYMGAFDDNFDGTKVKKRYLPEAVAALLAGKEPTVRESLQRGCAIEYAGDQPESE
jgi:peroxiredoxin